MVPRILTGGRTFTPCHQPPFRKTAFALPLAGPTVWTAANILPGVGIYACIVLRALAFGTLLAGECRLLHPKRIETIMDAASERDDLIDVVIRLPRKAIEDTLLSMPPDARDPSERRHAEARAVLAGRRRRATHFNGVRFYDPSWDMILELYVATCERRRIAVSQLCKLSGGSTTTALRHIEHLEALGYIVRQTDPDDGRRLIVGTLTPLISAAEHWLDLQIAESQLQDRRLG